MSGQQVGSRCHGAPSPSGRHRDIHKRSGRWGGATAGGRGWRSSVGRDISGHQWEPGPTTPAGGLPPVVPRITILAEWEVWFLATPHSFSPWSAAATLSSTMSTARQAAVLESDILWYNGVYLVK